MAKRVFLAGFKTQGLSFEAFDRNTYTRVSVKNRDRETLEQVICHHDGGETPSTVLARLKTEWLD